MFKHLSAVYNKYHAKRARCTAELTPAEEQKYIDQLVKVFKKVDDQSTADAEASAEALFQEMQNCAAQYKKNPSEVGDECVRSSVPGSRKYIPDTIMQYKEKSKDLRKAQKAEADLSLWWNQFYAKQRRLNPF
jgi:hypothetical protein